MIIMNRTNTLFSIAGTLATFALVASGIFITAHYVTFLSPIAALGVFLPIALTLFALSAVVLAISCKKIISQDEEHEAARQKDRQQVQDCNTIMREFQHQIEEIRYQINNNTAKNPSEKEPDMKFFLRGQERVRQVKGITKFSDLIFTPDLKKKLQEICKSQKDTNAPRHYLFSGAPGCGKTESAWAIANETMSNSAFISVTASELSTPEKIKSLFRKAEENAPCIIFMDEIDGIGMKRMQNTENATSLTYLLTYLDGDNAVPGATVISSTNFHSSLDSALVRAGRFETIIFPELDQATRKSIINDTLKVKLNSSHIKKISECSKGFSPANLADLIKEFHKQIDMKTIKKLSLTKSQVENMCRDYANSHNIKNEDKKSSMKKTISTCSISSVRSQNNGTRKLQHS